jgi:hypothetical protein
MIQEVSAGFWAKSCNKIVFTSLNGTYLTKDSRKVKKAEISMSKHT